MIISHLFPVGVTGNTTDSESVIPGSNPGWGALVGLGSLLATVIGATL